MATTKGERRTKKKKLNNTENPSEQAKKNVQELMSSLNVSYLYHYMKGVLVEDKKQRRRRRSEERRRKERQKERKKHKLFSCFTQHITIGLRVHFSPLGLECVSDFNQRCWGRNKPQHISAFTDISLRICGSNSSSAPQGN